MAGYLERLKAKKRFPQALQKLQKGSNTPEHDTAKTAKSPFYSKCSEEGGLISEIQAPEPAGLGPEYTDLWNRAWNLADWIDDPYGAPIGERRAKLSELDDLKERMVKIVRHGGHCGRQPGKIKP